MMDWIGTTEPEPTTYADAAAAAKQYAYLRKKVGHSGGPDMDLRKMYSASFKAGRGAFTWTPLDAHSEYFSLLVCFREAYREVELLTEKCAEWWSVWWLVRVEGVATTGKPRGYSRSHVNRILNAIDDEIHIELEVRGLLTGSEETPSYRHDDEFFDTTNWGEWNPDAGRWE